MKTKETVIQLLIQGVLYSIQHNHYETNLANFYFSPKAEHLLGIAKRLKNFIDNYPEIDSLKVTTVGGNACFWEMTFLNMDGKFILSNIEKDSKYLAPLWVNHKKYFSLNYPEIIILPYNLLLFTKTPYKLFESSSLFKNVEIQTKIACVLYQNILSISFYDPENNLVFSEEEYMNILLKTIVELDPLAFILVTTEKLRIKPNNKNNFPLSFLYSITNNLAFSAKKNTIKKTVKNLCKIHPSTQPLANMVLKNAFFQELAKETNCLIEESESSLILPYALFLEKDEFHLPNSLTVFITKPQDKK